MKSRPYRLAAVFIALAGALGAAGLVGIRWGRQRQAEGQLLAAAHISSRMERLHALAGLRDTNRVEAEQAALRLLDHTDASVRRGAADFLNFTYPPLGGHPMPETESSRMAHHLRTDPDPVVRLTCAVALMEVKTADVREAYITALNDPYDKVAQLACWQIGERAGPGTREELTAVLSRPSWQLRLEACKALIRSGLADDGTVAALAKMDREPEAAAYDAQIDEFDRMEREDGVKPGSTWGKLDLIVQRAREIAARNGRTTRP